MPVKLAALAGVELDYDARERGTRVECDPQCAIDETQALQRDLQAAQLERHIDRSVRVRALVQPDADPLLGESSIGRELVFVVSHTIHHQAMISDIARRLDVALPDDFGYAPSTVQHLNSTRCAQSAS